MCLITSVADETKTSIPNLWVGRHPKSLGVVTKSVVLGVFERECGADATPVACGQRWPQATAQCRYNLAQCYRVTNCPCLLRFTLPNAKRQWLAPASHCPGQCAGVGHGATAGTLGGTTGSVRGTRPSTARRSLARRTSAIACVAGLGGKLATRAANVAGQKHMGAPTLRWGLAWQATAGQQLGQA